MNPCSVEIGLLSKKPCGHVAVAMCFNCEQSLCVEHAVPQLSEAGKRTGKFMCKECVAAEKEHAKSMDAVARSQDAKKKAAIEKAMMEQAVAAAAPKPAAAGAPQAPAKPAPAEQSKPDVLEFTSKDSKPAEQPKPDVVAPTPAPAKQPAGLDVIEFTPTPKDGKS